MSADNNNKSIKKYPECKELRTNTVKHIWASSKENQICMQILRMQISQQIPADWSVPLLFTLYIV